jgi:hypothetical protein
VSEHARTLGPKGSDLHKAAVIGDTRLLLEHLESHFIISLASATSSVPHPQNIDHLLKHLGSLIKQSIFRGATAKKGSASKLSKKSSSRYAVRVVLCAYMTLRHLNAVLSGRGKKKISHGGCLRIHS